MGLYNYFPQIFFTYKHYSYIYLNLKTMALTEIKPEFRAMIIARCQDENPIGDGIQCPRCGALEAYKNRENPSDTTKWSWMVRAFKIDDYSHCKNCDNWFGL